MADEFSPRIRRALQAAEDKSVKWSQEIHGAEGKLDKLLRDVKTIARKLARTGLVIDRRLAEKLEQESVKEFRGRTLTKSERSMMREISGKLSQMEDVAIGLRRLYANLSREINRFLNKLPAPLQRDGQSSDAITKLRRTRETAETAAEKTDVVLQKIRLMERAAENARERDSIDEVLTSFGLVATAVGGVLGLTVTGPAGGVILAGGLISFLLGRIAKLAKSAES